MVLTRASEIGFLGKRAKHPADDLKRFRAAVGDEFSRDIERCHILVGSQFRRARSVERLPRRVDLMEPFGVAGQTVTARLRGLSVVSQKVGVVADA